MEIVESVEIVEIIILLDNNIVEIISVTRKRCGDSSKDKSASEATHQRTKVVTKRFNKGQKR